MKAGLLLTLPIATADGEFLARYSENGLAKLAFPNAKTLAAPKRGEGKPIPTKIRAWHRLTVAALKAVLAGHAAKKLPPLDGRGTAFQQAVWHELLKIPQGQTRSYGEMARLLGRPRAVRAVGGACGANPIPVLVPCHRVLAANRQLGGFSGGLDWKRRLLVRESVIL
jgi:AraC family transcriptional regulator of adaptative response/methylated-DNA-[protein]-cysteine methyltransferase